MRSTPPATLWLTAPPTPGRLSRRKPPAGTVRPLAASNYPRRNCPTTQWIGGAPRPPTYRAYQRRTYYGGSGPRHDLHGYAAVTHAVRNRSEERRVGKGGGARWRPEKVRKAHGQ